LSWFLAFAGFAVLIILHEFGHFTAAKAVGMRVERFGLFFPPFILKKRVGETEYGIGAIPLGGFVKITGMNPDEELPPDVAHRGYYHQPVWKRIVVIGAGPFVNLAIAFLILFGLAFGAQELTSRVSETAPGSPAERVLEPGDRIVSVEMFEHMRNYRELFRRISGWLQPDGRFFMHIFCHRSCAYAFLDDGPSDWMGRHFFSGGIMPSDDLPLRFQEHLRLLRRDRWNGRHYERTAYAWLANMDARRERILPILSATYGADRAEQWFQRWRIFFMACAELFGLNDGREWYVAHYLFGRRDAAEVSSA